MNMLYFFVKEIFTLCRPGSGNNPQQHKKARTGGGTSTQGGTTATTHTQQSTPARATPAPAPTPTGAEKYPENWDLLEGIWPFEDRPEGKIEFICYGIEFMCYRIEYTMVKN